VLEVVVFVSGVEVLVSILLTDLIASFKERNSVKNISVSAGCICHRNTFG
jgi:hypothetical protein